MELSRRSKLVGGVLLIAFLIVAFWFTRGSGHGVFASLILFFVLWTLHAYLPLLIADAADRRGCFYAPWISLGVLTGPILIGIAYLLFVARRTVRNEASVKSQTL